MTHAGFHQSWLENVLPGRYREYIDTVCADAWNCLNRGEHHFLLGRGASRSGDQLIGGINWMDWHELVPIPGLNQLTGHTQSDAVRYHNVVDSRNICLDTGLRHYAVFADGQLDIKSYKELIAS